MSLVPGASSIMPLRIAPVVRRRTDQFSRPERATLSQAGAEQPGLVGTAAATEPGKLKHRASTRAGRGDREVAATNLTNASVWHSPPLPAESRIVTSIDRATLDGSDVGSIPT